MEWVIVQLNCRKDGGSTVLIIKDKEGCVYGGYASQPFERHGDFYGDMKSFLFQLYPKASIFRPTGANKNLQWVSFYCFHMVLSSKFLHFGTILDESRLYYLVLLIENNSIFTCCNWSLPKCHNFLCSLISLWIIKIINYLLAE